MGEQEKIIIEAEEEELEAQELGKKPSARVLKFRLGSEDYCTAVTQVKEVIRVPEITRLPLP
jgi:chemotaxis signal transduction protein